MQSAVERNSGAPLTASSFDFLPGTWAVSMRRRTVNGHLEILSEWTPFRATAAFQRVLGGKAVVGTYEMHMPAGIVPAIDARFFDAANSSWTIYWASGDDAGWQDNPMKGGFAAEGATIFVNDDTVDGQPVQTRYVWRVPSADRATWEQSFSNDHGATWVSNWFMDFTRVVT